MRYKVIITTDPYHARRESGYTLDRQRTMATKAIAEDLSLEDARQEILRQLNYDSDSCFASLEDAYKELAEDFSLREFGDGTLSYTYDVYEVEITRDEEGTVKEKIRGIIDAYENCDERISTPKDIADEVENLLSESSGSGKSFESLWSILDQYAIARNEAVRYRGNYEDGENFLEEIKKLVGYEV